MAGNWETEKIKVQEMAPGIYAALAKSGMGAWSNAGFVDLGDATLIFDTYYIPSAGKELRQAAEELTGKPVKYLVNSHRHMDHILGNQHFADTTIIASTYTLVYLEKVTRPMIHAYLAEPVPWAETLREIEQRLSTITDPFLLSEVQREYADNLALARELSSVTLTFPTVTFDKTLTIHGSERSVVLYSLGGAHTERDTFLHIPDANILFMGDVGQFDHHVMLAQGRPQIWKETLRFALALRAQLVLGGHGPVSNAERLNELVFYIEYYEQMVQESLAYGTSLETLLSQPIPEAFARWHYPMHVPGNLRFLSDLLRAQA